MRHGCTIPLSSANVPIAYSNILKIMVSIVGACVVDAEAAARGRNEIPSGWSLLPSHILLSTNTEMKNDLYPCIDPSGSSQTAGRGLYVCDGDASGKNINRF